jgi:hypothetical protein
MVRIYTEVGKKGILFGVIKSFLFLSRPIKNNKTNGEEK